MNVYINNWHGTGQDVPVPQYEVDLRLEWIDSDGQARTWEGTPRFPNVLADLPPSWVKDAMEDLIVRAVRYKLGDV